jgi:hypothetical protein
VPYLAMESSSYLASSNSVSGQSASTQSYWSKGLHALGNSISGWFHPGQELLVQSVGWGMTLIWRKLSG